MSAWLSSCAHRLARCGVGRYMCCTPTALATLPLVQVHPYCTCGSLRQFFFCEVGRFALAPPPQLNSHGHSEQARLCNSAWLLHPAVCLLHHIQEPCIPCVMSCHVIEVQRHHQASSLLSMFCMDMRHGGPGIPPTYACPRILSCLQCCCRPHKAVPCVTLPRVSVVFEFACVSVLLSPCFPCSCTLYREILEDQRCC